MVRAYNLPEAKVISSGVEIPGMIWIWEVFELAISFGAMQLAIIKVSLPVSLKQKRAA